MAGFSYTTATASNESSVVRGNVALVSGTWAAGGMTTVQSIVTGGSAVLAYNVTMKVAVTIAPAVSASAGTIYVTDALGNGLGDWNAIVRL